MPLVAGNEAAFAGVSIHAPRFQGAMPWPVAAASCSRRFQSTLPVSRERCLAEGCTADVVGVSIHAPRFQGAMPGGGASCLGDDRVSIHAPRFQGAMRLGVWVGDFLRWFQSTLPVSRERCARVLVAAVILDQVSIHAPRFQGAMPSASNSSVARDMFQSTLPVSRERCANAYKEVHCYFEFQSTLPVSRERCLRLIRSRRSVASFNPRSPFPGSDARQRQTVACESGVSIHAPRFQGAMPLSHCGDSCSSRFQSTLPVSRERCAKSSFFRSGSGVSIHAPRFQGAMQGFTGQSGVNYKFQSTLPVSRERCSV